MIYASSPFRHLTAKIFMHRNAGRMYLFLFIDVTNFEKKKTEISLPFKWPMYGTVMCVVKTTGTTPAWLLTAWVRPLAVFSSQVCIAHVLYCTAIILIT